MGICHGFSLTLRISTDNSCHGRSPCWSLPAAITQYFSSVKSDHLIYLLLSSFLTLLSSLSYNGPLSSSCFFMSLLKCTLTQQLEVSLKTHTSKSHYPFPPIPLNTSMKFSSAIRALQGLCWLLHASLLLTS